MRGRVSSSAELEIEVDLSDARQVVIRLDGELDAYTAPRLHEVVSGLDDRDVVLDLTGLRFMDSAGVGSIAELSQRGPLTVRHPSARVIRVLDLTGLTAVVTVEPREP